MAEQQIQQQQQQQQREEDTLPLSALPVPPPFYKAFTSANISKLKDFKSHHGIEEPAGGLPLQLTPDQLLQLPAELRYLVPPEPPRGDEEFRVFNEVTQENGKPPTLKDWDYEQLYPSPPSPPPGADPSIRSDWTLDSRKYLKDLVRSALFAFLELLAITARNPTHPDKDEKLAHIATIIANMHALINEYRPHQARETLIRMMEEQLGRKRKEVEGIRKMKEKVAETLAEFSKNAPRVEKSLGPEEAEALAAEEKRIDGQRQMWAAMDEILGH
ncbi:mediator of RNA polymerase II transcription subunit 7 [Lophiotrema nucula]|uniref:Mediator of RNA polymerase II transcription subunit 7 n=1 Tax=Lophiotrema nucula TaxID=690887 RepID=A0A6A5ZF86_9PLEO|nr:mediator of RNA polymerase II transcription subunit 7 [Lophiotrema nucula]